LSGARFAGSESERGLHRTKLRPIKTGLQWVVKFVLAILAYLAISFVLGWGILLLVRGNPWLLIVGFIAYALAFARFGCLPAKQGEH